MAYSDLANNQCVSFNSLISGVAQGYFSAKTSIPSSSQMTTKSACNTYVNVDPFYPPFAAKADNQLVVKDDLKDNVALVRISNGFFIGTITDVTVNGVSITNATFPLDIGNNTVGYTNQIGTYDITLYYADADMPGNWARCTDSALANTCIDNFTSLGPGPYYITFPSQVINTSIELYIETGDGQCSAPPPTLISTLPFSTVAVSRGTGQYMLAGNANIGNPFTEGTLFRSTNYGANWELIGQLGYWNKVAISDNGQYMLAVEYYGRAYKSSDYGDNWTAINNFPFPARQDPSCQLPALQTLRFRGAALSSDGQFQVISTASNYYGTCGSGTGAYDVSYSIIFRSTDYGATWTVAKNDYVGGVGYDAVAMSANGQIVLATSNVPLLGGSILFSNNSGANWINAGNSYNIGNLVDVSILADGSQAIAARFSNNLNNLPYLISSTDGGLNWVTVEGGGIGQAQQQWMRVAINVNGAADAYALPNTNSSPKYKFRVPFLNTVVVNYALGQKYWKSVANSNNGYHILLGANNGLFVSNDQGVTYTAIQSVG